MRIQLIFLGLSLEKKQADDFLFRKFVEMLVFIMKDTVQEMKACAKHHISLSRLSVSPSHRFLLFWSLFFFVITFKPLKAVSFKQTSSKWISSKDICFSYWSNKAQYPEAFWRLQAHYTAH